MHDLAAVSSGELAFLEHREVKAAGVARMKRLIMSSRSKRMVIL
jgi:hypothetical protein